MTAGEFHGPGGGLLGELGGSGSAPVAQNLRVLLLGARFREARHYYVSTQLLPVTKVAQSAVVTHDVDGALTKDYVARTDVSALSNAPKFNNRCFVLRVPEADGTGAGGCVLRLQVFAAQAGTSGQWNTPNQKFGLLGYHDFELQGDIVRRMLRGDHVKVTGTLSHSKDDEVAVEVVLLDAPGVLGALGNPHAADSCLLAPGALLKPKPKPKAPPVAAPAAAPAATPPQAAEPPAAEAAKEVVCPLQVLVTKATGLPLVHSTESGKRDALPNVFVALKSARQAQAKMPAQATTQPIKSTDPVWNKLLSVDVIEAELETERMLMALVNADTNKLLAKAALPLKPMQPGRHYNLHLVLEEPVDGNPAPEIFITMCLTPTPKSQLAFAKANPDFFRVEAHIDSVDNIGNAPKDLAASWSIVPNAIAIDTTTPPPPLNAYTLVEVFAQIESYNNEITAMNAEYAREVMCGQPFWPKSHATALHITQAALDEQDHPTLLLELHNLAANQASSKSSHAGEGEGTEGKGDGEGAVGGGAQKPTLVARGTVTLATLKESRPGEAITQALSLWQGDETQLVSLANLSLRYWPADDFRERCEAEAAPSRRASSAASQPPGEQPPDSPTSHHDLEGMPSRLATPLDSFRPGGPGTGAVGTMLVERLEALCEDMRDKQHALETILQVTDRSQLTLLAHSEETRQKEMTMKNLEADVTELRRILHEEKKGQAARAEHIAKMPHQELVECAQDLTARHALALKQNQELTHRLQQLHGEMVKAKGVQEQFEELQDAHHQQALQMRKLEDQSASVGKYKETLKAQENIIAHLEELLTNVVRGKGLPTPDLPNKPKGLDDAEGEGEDEGEPPEDPEALLAENDELRQENDTLKQEAALMQEERDALKEQLDALKREQEQNDERREDMDDKVEALEEEKMELVMRLEAAETKVKAQANELKEASKRAATDLAKLKTKLAEKDAQLMGGFGDFSKLPLGEVGKPKSGLGAGKPTPMRNAPAVHKSGAKRGAAPANGKLKPLAAAPRPPSAQSQRSAVSSRSARSAASSQSRGRSSRASSRASSRSSSRSAASSRSRSASSRASSRSSRSSR